MTRLNLLRPHNTDGIINGLVTVFAFAPAPMTNLKWPLHPDTRICTQLKSCTMTIFWLRDKLHRDTAPVPIYQISTPGAIPVHLETLYRDRASTQ
jgi:hypothetical protein